MNYQQEFILRTERHIKLVNKYAKLIGKEYPKHDSDKLTTLFEGYSLMKKTNITPEEQAKIDSATYKHVTSNAHHCEYWSMTSIDGFTRANPTPHGALDVQLMTQCALMEMCCDWCAMSEEFGNSPYEWLNKVNGTRWEFTDKQLDFINTILKQLWKD